MTARKTGTRKTGSRKAARKATRKATRKAAAKKTTRRAARKTAAKKTPKRTTKKTARGTARGAALAKANRAKMALIERLESLGLLDQDAVERLENKADSLVAGSGGGIEDTVAWDKALQGTLGSFAEGGGDGSAKRIFQALITWQESLRTLPETPDGLHRALTGLKKVVPFHGASLYLRNPDDQSVNHFVSVGFEVQLVNRIRFMEGAGFSAWVADRKKPVLYASLHRNEAPDSENVRSFMSVPLMVGEHCMGVLNLGHRDENAYDPAHLRRLLLAAGILAGLVQRYVAQAQIKAREISDPATGLATAGYFRRRLEEEVVRCRELGHSMSLLTFRLAELPEHVNQFGEDFRNRCRLEIGRIAAAWRESTELVGHGRGDSLVVILPSARREKALLRAEAFAQAVRKHNFPRRKRMTVEFGLATYPADAEESQELLDSVDKSLQEGPEVQNGLRASAMAM